MTTATTPTATANNTSDMGTINATEWQPCEVICFHTDLGMLVEFERSDRNYSNGLHFRAYVPYFMFNEGQVSEFDERLNDCETEQYDATHAEEWEELAKDVIDTLWYDPASL